MGIQEGLLVVVAFAAVYYIFRHIRRQYISSNADGENDCGKCNVKEVNKSKRSSRKIQKS